MSDNNDTLRQLYVNAMTIYVGSAQYNIDWEITYDKIFSENISRKVLNLVDLDYCDPDTSYEDDVKAFVSAFQEYMEKSYAPISMAEIYREINSQCNKEYECT